MNRRSFFSSLLGSCGAAGTCAVAQSTAPSASEVSKEIGQRLLPMIKDALKPKPLSIDYLDRQGLPWTLRWTGWKARDSSTELFGQWIAYAIHPGGKLDHRRLHVYSSAPGGVAYFTWGYTFNIGLHDGQESIHQISSEPTKEAQKQLAFTRLVHFLDNQPQIPEYRAYTSASL